MRTVCCSVCGSERQKFFLQEDRFTVVRCMDCGHLYTSPLPEAAQVEEAYSASGDWIKQADIAVSSGADQRYQRYISAIGGILPPGARVLDIGCSKGRFIYQLQQRGYDCYGVEPSRDAAFAQQLMGADRIWHLSYREPLSIEADLVTMFEVLEHIHEPHITAALVFQQIRPGGYFMGSVPNGAFIRAKVLPRRVFGIHSMIVPLIMDAGNHINYFSASGLRRMLERVGFEFLWVRNAPLDFNYTANRLSPFFKRGWAVLTHICQFTTGSLLGSNIWFLARKSDR
jgi:SAM-dependent methyltransferase